MTPDVPSDAPLLDPDRARYGQDGLSSAQVDAMLAALDAERAEAGVRERLREQPGWARVAGLAGVGAALTLLLVLATGLRPDLQGGEEARLALILAAFAVAGVAGLAVAARGMHQPPMGRRAWGIAALCLGLPVAAGVAPGLMPGIPMPEGKAWIHLFCFGLAAGVALGVAIAAALLDRSERPPLWRGLSAAGAGGVLGALAILLHCPIADPLHMLLGHALPGLVLAGAAVAWLRR
ncbi:MAG: DUF1109 family protein [Alphaproteobacteria bacterium]|nr:DUF1109 family protein [Alphaproteobacteria bacterium]